MVDFGDERDRWEKNGKEAAILGASHCKKPTDSSSSGEIHQPYNTQRFLYIHAHT